MPCTVKKTFKAALETKNHLLAQVKDNQPNLLQMIADNTKTAAPLKCYKSVDRKKRKREETRCVKVFDAVPLLENTAWSGLIKRIILVKRTTLIRGAKKGMGRTREEISYYVCSAPIGAKKAANAVRGHWAIENKNHYVRDVAMHEDASRIRTNPGVFARLRSFALNVLRFNNEKNIADALWENALNFNRLLQYRYE